MPETTPIKTPARYASAFAIGSADPEGNLLLVSQDRPLPVSMAEGESAPANVLDGTTSADALVGPFDPHPVAPINVTLSGSWSGEVRFLRSTDGGTTLHPLTIAGLPWAHYTANVNEQVWTESEASATFYLDIAITGGTLAYRVAQ